MRIGERVIFKDAGIIKKGLISKMGYDYVEICDENNNRFKRGYWEIRKDKDD